MNNINKALQDVASSDKQVRAYKSLQNVSNIYLSEGSELTKLNREEQTEINTLLDKFIIQRNSHVAKTRKYLEAVDGMLICEESN